MTATYNDPRVLYASAAYDYLGNPQSATGEVELSFDAVQTVEAESADEHSVEVSIS